ncbi:LacI family transcriptional regulator [Geobacillus kaustophilus NBRC 102445]|uniref:LacI family DNA-binding transcriptional regulator n=1 Tax=Geobacillus thermoleovorans group TaxID=1505648 RepID=UPI0005A9BDB6|nr:LacI family DNA-binding transcriptional regulator [Geobacillus kaustophilus]MED4972827.1 LacI family DNA-binding transcriptional regulator [Geobacillus thermoleovorans]QCK82058.1 LacI family transcriptional regulator [Geobacillus kaustophilus NBRC 102445]
MTVTIKDVAKRANVAPSTVSRVIADSPRISEKTKQKVRAAMKELGYHPNFIARSLASQATQVIGIVMPSSADQALQNPFFPEVIRGISKAAHEKRYALQMSTGEKESDIYERVVEMLQGRRVDGVILLYSRQNDKLMKYLQKHDFPFVVIGKPHQKTEQVTHVDNDNVQAGKDAANWLIARGHERIAFVGGNPQYLVTVDRQTGYAAALQEAGLPYRPEYVVHAEFLQEGGQEAMKELLSLPEPPTGLVVADDLMALGMLKTLDEMGLGVPEDVSIVSFNNTLLAEMSRPPLTSIDIGIFQLGYEAAKSLIEKVENPNEPIKRIIIPHRLVERGSCARR